MEKTNIEHLRDILNGFNKTHGIDITEAEDFLEAAEEELDEANDEIKNLKYDNDSDDDEEKEEPEYDNSDFVGLDTIHWSLDNGNLRIQQQMEGFILRLKEQNCVGVSYS